LTIFNKGAGMPDICPLILIAVKETGFITEIEEKQSRCLRNDCAWFVTHEDPDKAGCAIKVLSDSMVSISPKMTI